MPSKDPDFSDSETRLSAILEGLPVAIAMFDGSGQFAMRSGALNHVLGTAIPSRDPRGIGYWQISHATGQMADPPDWPGARVLRGETNVPAMTGLYSSPRSAPRRLRITASPFRDTTLPGGLVLLQDLDQERRGRDGLHDHLENRFADALFHAVATVVCNDNFHQLAAARAHVDKTMGFPQRPSLDGLSAKEAEVLKLVAWGKTHKQIATQLGFSLRKVQSLRAAAAAKLNLKSREDIVRYALSRHWLGEDG